MAVLYVCAGRLSAQNSGFRPGQMGYGAEESARASAAAGGSDMAAALDYLLARDDQAMQTEVAGGRPMDVAWQSMAEEMTGQAITSSPYSEEVTGRGIAISEADMPYEEKLTALQAAGFSMGEICAARVAIESATEMWLASPLGAQIGVGATVRLRRDWTPDEAMDEAAASTSRDPYVLKSHRLCTGDICSVIRAAAGYCFELQSIEMVHGQLTVRGPGLCWVPADALQKVVRLGPRAIEHVGATEWAQTIYQAWAPCRHTQPSDLYGVTMNGDGQWPPRMTASSHRHVRFPESCACVMSHPRSVAAPV